MTKPDDYEPLPPPSDFARHKVRLVCPYCGSDTVRLYGLVPKNGEFERVFTERDGLLPWRKRYYALAMCQCRRARSFKVYMTRDQAKRFDAQERDIRGEERSGRAIG